MLSWQSGVVLSTLLALSSALSHPAVRSSYKRYTSSEARPLQAEQQLACQVKQQVACQVVALATSTHSKSSRISLMLYLGAELLALRCLGGPGAPGAPGVWEKTISL